MNVHDDQHFAKQIGAHARPLHPAALIIVNPDKPDNDQARVWTAPSVEEGVDYLACATITCRAGVPATPAA